MHWLLQSARYLRAIALLLLLLSCSAAMTQAAPGIDLGRDRLLHKFDFEEADDGNFEDMPRFWYVMGRSDQTSDPNFPRKPLHRQMLERDGFPKFTRVRFNQPQSAPGEHNLHLALNGGSAGAFLEVGAMAAVPNSDYVVTARIKTSELRNARARLIAYFVDSEGRRIDASAVTTPLLTTRGKWEDVTVKLLGDHPAAAWICMQVELLQVQHQTSLTASDATRAIASGKHTVQYQDNKGDAWFDDIAIWQVPRIVVRTQNEVNLITMPQKPLLTFEVRDLSGRKLAADVGVYDHHGKRIAQMTRDVGGGDAATWRWTPQLPGLGWYLVDMTLRDPDAKDASASAEPVARTIRVFLWLPARERLISVDKRNFSLDVQNASLDELRLLPQVTQATGLSNLILSAWDNDVSIATQETRMSELDAIFQPLWRQGAVVSMSLAPLPRELADRLDLDAESPVWLFEKPAKDWMQWVGPLVIRHGQNVRRWHMGKDVGGEFGSATIDPVTVRAVEAVKDLTPDPRIVLPWQLSTPRRAALNRRELTFAIEVSPSIRPSLIQSHLQEWMQPPKQDVVMTIPIAPATEMTQSRRIDDLAMRALHAWEAGVDGVTLPRPWAHTQDRTGALHPDPLLSVYATLSHQLNGRRAVGRLRLSANAQAIIYNGIRGPMLAAWLDGGPEDRREVDMFVGDEPTVTDVWGNTTEPELVNGKHRLSLTSTPVFIEGVDAELALFRSSFAVTPKLIESSQVSHEHAITLKNPWPHALQGDLTIIEPGRDWKIDPRRISVAIEPGATATFPISIIFPVAEVAGDKQMIARFEFAAGKRRSVDLDTTMVLGLSGIEMDSGLSVAPGRTPNRYEASATAFITNTSEQTRTLYIFAICANQPRQERILTLKPGQSLMRRFRFGNLTEEGLKSPVRIGLRDTTGPALMNHVLLFDDGAAP